MKKQSGFTLIELVMVIVILGILAATALPKFIDLSSDARTAALSGIRGSIASAAALTYAKAVVANQAGATGTISVDGATINLAYGFPDETSINAVLQDNGGATYAAGPPATFTLQTNCSISYTQSASAGAFPAITTINSGC